MPPNPRLPLDEINVLSGIGHAQCCLNAGYSRSNDQCGLLDIDSTLIERSVMGDALHCR